MSLLHCFITVLWCLFVTIPLLTCLVFAIWGLCRLIDNLDNLDVCHPIARKEQHDKIMTGSAMMLCGAVFLATAITWFSANGINPYDLTQVRTYLFPAKPVVVQTPEHP